MYSRANVRFPRKDCEGDQKNMLCSVMKTLVFHTNKHVILKEAPLEINVWLKNTDTYDLLIIPYPLIINEPIILA